MIFLKGAAWLVFFYFPYPPDIGGTLQNPDFMQIN